MITSIIIILIILATSFILFGLGVVLMLTYLYFLGFFTRGRDNSDMAVRKGFLFFSGTLVRFSRLKYKVTGADKLPESDFLLYPNHQHYTDPFILLREFCLKDIGGFANKELA